MAIFVPSRRLLVHAALLAAATLLVTHGDARAGSIVTIGGCVANDCSGPPEPNSGYVAVAAGNYHGLGLRSDGSIETWGLCDIGQCDVPLPNIGYDAIAAGDSHSIALKDGQIIAWGGEQGIELVPQPNEGFVAIASGLLHGIALRSDGSVVTWGGTPAGLSSPPSPNSGFVAVAGSGYESLALRADGTVVKWPCASGSSTCTQPVPNGGFVAISGHWNYSLAIRGSDGAIVGWGTNSHGQLEVPEPNGGFVKVAAGAFFAMGVREDGSLAAWGNPVMLPDPNEGIVDISANSGTAFGIQAIPCQLDAQCDDGVWCNGGESCVNGVCEPGPPPCAGAPCSEGDDACVECTSSAHCDDGLSCNGVETCVGGVCVPGTPPCSAASCDEALDDCLVAGDAWLSFTGATAVPGLGTVADEDIVQRDASTGAWSMVFDGSDVGLSGLAIDGMARQPDGSILLSFSADAGVPALSGGPNGVIVDDSDIVRFVPTSLGPTTAGQFVFHFDGSDVGLTNENEDVDAIALTSSGQLLLSTAGNASASGAGGSDADLLRFNATSLGASTAGTFALHFDGSDVGLSDNGNEDVDAADVRASGAIVLSTLGAFSVPGLSGGDEDVIAFTPASLGSNTSGTHALFLDLSALGIAASANVGAVDVAE